MDICKAQLRTNRTESASEKHNYTYMYNDLNRKTLLHSELDIGYETRGGQRSGRKTQLAVKLSRYNNTPSNSIVHVHATLYMYTQYDTSKEAEVAAHIGHAG